MSFGKIPLCTSRIPVRHEIVAAACSRTVGVAAKPCAARRDRPFAVTLQINELVITATQQMAQVGTSRRWGNIIIFTSRACAIDQQGINLPRSCPYNPYSLG